MTEITNYVFFVWKSKIMVTPFVKQSWIMTGVLLNAVGQGMVLSYPFCLLPALKAEESTIKVDLNTASYLASCLGYTMTSGLFVGVFLMDVFGRRLAYSTLIITSSAGWLLIYFATNVTMLIIGRLFGGLTNAIGHVVGCAVMGEYASPEYRGLFLNLKTVAFSVGNTIIHVTGNYFHWRTVALICMVPFILSFIINCTWVESPSWLVEKNRFEESEKEFYWLRGTSVQSVKEFNDMVRVQKERISERPFRISYYKRLLNFLKKLTEKKFYKPLFLIIFAFGLLESCGRHYFPAYAHDIIGGVTNDNSQLFMYTLCIDILILFSTVLSSFLIRRLRRRTLLFFSAISSIILLFAISLYLYLLSNKFVLNNKTWILPSLLIVYYVSANFGCTTIPLVLFGELFPLPHRGSLSAVGGVVTCTLITLSLKFPPIMFVALKVHGTFAVFAIIMTISLVYLYFGLPETKNRTLQEIEEFYSHGRFLLGEYKKTGHDEENATIHAIIDTRMDSK